MKLFLATGNMHKVEEMKKILAGIDIKLIAKTEFKDLPEVIEDADTFTGNALKKAREMCQCTNLPTIADDSGLVVDSLDGKPGVYSARFAGEDATDEDNNKKLLNLLKDIPAEERTAHFVCAMAFVTPDGEEEIIIGKCYGRIAFEAVGETGFGYDPLFIVDEYDKTFAQLGSSIKNKISHRAKALTKMKDVLLAKFN